MRRKQSNLSYDGNKNRKQLSQLELRRTIIHLSHSEMSYQINFKEGRTYPAIVELHERWCQAPSVLPSTANDATYTASLSLYVELSLATGFPEHATARKGR